MVHNKTHIATILDNLAFMEDNCGNFSTLAFFPIAQDIPNELIEKIHNPVFLFNTTADDNLFPDALLDFRVHTVYPYFSVTFSPEDAVPIDLHHIEKFNRGFKLKRYNCLSFLTIEAAHTEHFAPFIDEANAIVELYDNKYSKPLNFRYLLNSTYMDSRNVISIDVMESLCHSKYGGYAQFHYLEYSKAKFEAQTLLIIKDIKDYLEDKDVIDLYVTFHIREDLISIFPKRVGLKTLKALEKYNIIIDFIYDSEELDIEAIDVVYSCQNPNKLNQDIIIHNKVQEYV